MRLPEAPGGGPVVVVAIEGSDPLARRLRSLGFVPGATVDVLQRAPFGGSTAYHLAGYRVALRDDEANRVVVRHV